MQENRCFSCDLESLGWCAVHGAPCLCGDNANHGTKKWCGNQREGTSIHSQCQKCSKCKCPGMKTYLSQQKREAVKEEGEEEGGREEAEEDEYDEDGEAVEEEGEEERGREEGEEDEDDEDSRGNKYCI